MESMDMHITREITAKIDRQKDNSYARLYPRYEF